MLGAALRDCITIIPLGWFSGSGARFGIHLSHLEAFFQLRFPRT